MRAPPLRPASSCISSGFASLALRRACILHRTAQLATYVHPARQLRRKASTRRYATATNENSSRGRGPNDAQPSFTSFAPEQDQAHQDIIRALDPYLPLALRSGTWLENLSNFEGVRSPASLPAALNEINRHFPRGALSHVALGQYRWSAYVYLGQALAKLKPSSEDDIACSLFEGSPWNTIHPGSFATIGHFDGHVVFPPDGNLQTQTTSHGGGRVFGDDGNSHLLKRGNGPNSSSLAASLDHAYDPQAKEAAISCLWQSLGHVVLDSTSRNADYAEYMLSHVHRILATMHHEGTIHPFIYSFESQSTKETDRKSPFLHIMSSRFLTVMSDATWRSQESKIIENYDLMKASDEKTDGPKLWDFDDAAQPVGVEAWLELILWSCVHGSHVDAAVAILEDMSARNQDVSWTTIAWQDLLETAGDVLHRNNGKKLKARFARLAGETYSKDPPIVALPDRTISREVVIAILQCMTSTPSPKGPWALLDSLNDLSRLLSPSHDYTDMTLWNMMNSRLLGAAGFPWEQRPAYVDSLAAASVVAETNFLNGGPNGADSVRSPRRETGSPVEILHHRAIDSFLAAGDLGGALKSFNRLQDWLDCRKRSAMDRFLEIARPQEWIDPRTIRFLEPSASDHEDLVFLRERSFHTSDLTDDLPDEYGLKLPSITLGVFLEQVVRQRMLDFGRWMVFSNDPDSTPLITGKHFNSAVVQPALIMLGVALDDAPLVRKVIKRVRHAGTVDANVLQASLQAQITLRKFTQAEAVLSVMRDRDIRVSNSSIFELARAILELETLPATATSQQELSSGSELLSRVLRAHFARPAAPHVRPNYVLRHRLNQLSCIIASVGGHLRAAARPGIVKLTSGQTNVAANDFNILLAAVARVQDPAMAKALYDRWCRPLGPALESVTDATPNILLPLTGYDDPEEDACVDPSVESVQAIIEPIMSNVRKGPEKVDSRRSNYNQDSLEELVRAKANSTGGNAALRHAHDARERRRERREVLQRSDGLRIKRALPLKPLDRPLLEWALHTFVEMGLSAEEIARDFPEVYEISEPGEATEKTV